MSAAVKNQVTECRQKLNTDQPTLWDGIEDSAPESEQKIYTLPFHWANDDTSEEAAQRMLRLVQGQTRYLYSHEVVNGHLIVWRANILEAWIDQGVVWGKCTVFPDGPYVRSETQEQGDEDE